MKLDKYSICIILALVIIIASFLRFYKLTSIPPSLDWDEVAVGYNAYTIANYGKDEWGQILPITFHSFGDDKHPVHVYLTAVSVKLLGPTDLSVRIPAAFLGVVNVVLIFFLGKVLFKNNGIGLIAAFFLAVSPYSIQFSRFNHELNFVLFFFFLGLLLFIKSLEKKNFLIIVSFLCFGIDLLAYHSAKIVVPSFILILIILYFKELWQNKFNFIVGVITFCIFISVVLLNPTLLGTARVNQTSFNKEDIQRTELFKSTKNETLGRLDIIYNQYLSHFSWGYLFETGDNNRRHSTNIVGELYKIDILFLLVGLFMLIKMKSKVTVILLTVLLLAPIPASLVKDAPHAARSMFLLGILQLICALGFYTLTTLTRNKFINVLIFVVLIGVLAFQSSNYIRYYFWEYSKKYAIEWQYGMKQIVEETKSSEYTKVFVTEERHQPYIFYLFYLKTNPRDLQSTVIYNQSKSKDYSLVEYFGKYNFGGWDIIGSMPNQGVAYVLTPSEYSGLRERLAFDIKKEIKFPDGGVAFYIVSAKK